MFQPLAGLLFVLGGAVQDAPMPSTYTLRLPPGPARRVLAGVGPKTVPAPLSSDLAALVQEGGSPWDQAAAWSIWAARLILVRQRLESPPKAGAPRDLELAAAHADLALLASTQGRGADAWAHFSALTDAPEQAARVLPHLIPGVPLDAKLGPGGAPLALKDGVLLRPILPEYPADDPARDLSWRTAEIFQLPVGDAHLHLRLSVESTGVELDLAHLRGPTVEVLGLLPEPAGYPIRYEYLDWIKVQALRSPTRVRLIPGEDEPHVLYGRVTPGPSPWPTPRPGHQTSALSNEGLWLVIDPDDEQHAWWQAAAEALGQLLGIPAGTRAPGNPGESRPGLDFQVPSAEEQGPGSRQAFARYLASALGAHVQGALAR